MVVMTKELVTSAKSDICIALSHRLGIPSKELERVLDWWTHHSPPDTQADASQDIALSWLEQKPATAGLAWAIGRHVVHQLWASWYKGRSYGTISLDSYVSDDSGMTLADVIVAEIDYEARYIGKIEASRIWGLLPYWVKPIVQAILTGQTVNNADRTSIRRWATEHTNLLLAS